MKQSKIMKTSVLTEKRLKNNKKQSFRANGKTSTGVMHRRNGKGGLLPGVKARLATQPQPLTLQGAEPSKPEAVIIFL
jgi:hypothetical protein